MTDFSRLEEYFALMMNDPRNASETQDIIEEYIKSQVALGRSGDSIIEELTSLKDFHKQEFIALSGGKTSMDVFIDNLGEEYVREGLSGMDKDELKKAVGGVAYQTEVLDVIETRGVEGFKDINFRKIEATTNMSRDDIAREPRVRTILQPEINKIAQERRAEYLMEGGATRQQAEEGRDLYGGYIPIGSFKTSAKRTVYGTRRG